MDDNKLILIASSGHGQYIPQYVTIDELDNPKWDWSEVSKEDIDALLEGPDNEWYHEAWDMALNNVRITHDGYEWTLMHNEDLWAVREDATEEELDNWMI